MSGESRLCYHAVPRVHKAKEEYWNNPIQSMSAQFPAIEPEQPTKKLRTEFPCIDSRETQLAQEWCMDPILYRQLSDDLFWMPFKNYMHESRININVRQVLRNDAQSL